MRPLTILVLLLTFVALLVLLADLPTAEQQAAEARRRIEDRVDVIRVPCDGDGPALRCIVYHHGRAGGIWCHEAKEDPCDR